MMMGKKVEVENKGKAMICIVMAMVMLTAVIASIPAVSAVSKGGEYNYIGKETGVVQIVLAGQNLQFNMSETVNDFATKPTVYRFVSGKLKDTWTPDSNWRFYNVNWPTTGAYYVSDDVSNKQGQAQISVKDPNIPLKLKVGTTEVSRINCWPNLTIDVGGISLNDNDRVDLVIIGPNGKIDYDAVNNQQFTNISVAELKANYGNDNLKTIRWDIGVYTFQVETIPEYACGLEASSGVKELIAICCPPIAIEADTTNTVELKTVAITVTGVAGDKILVSSTPAEDSIWQAGIEDTPTTGIENAEFSDTIDEDGVMKYAIKFTETKCFTIRAEVINSPRGARDGDYDTVDITVSEKNVEFDLPSTVVIGDMITIKGTSASGTYVTVYVDDTLYQPLKNLVLDDGKFEKEVTTTDIGMNVPGSVRLKAWIDCSNPPTAPSTTPDGEDAILLTTPELTAELSAPYVAAGDDFYVKGVAQSSTSVDIVTVPPKGGGEASLTEDREGIEIIPTRVSTTDNTFSRKLSVQDNASIGYYDIYVLSPGMDGVWDATNAGDLVNAIAQRYNIPDITDPEYAGTKSQDDIFALIVDLTTTAGCDDHMWVAQIKVEEPRVKLDPIADVAIGDPLIVTGVSNRKDGCVIVVTCEKHDDALDPAKVKIEDGKFNVTLDTTGASPGTYTVVADDGDGHTDTTTVVLKINVQISATITTDKVVYSPGEIMQTEIHIRNPTDNAEIVLFNWYLGIPEKEIWKTMVAIPVILPAGFDQTFTVPIPVGEWGKESFCGCYIVSLTDTKTGNVVSTDSTAWVYMPDAIFERERDTSLNRKRDNKRN